jgi:hypothetical protein
LVSEDNNVNRGFNIITYRIFDISSYKTLVIQSYIPATNKAIADTQKDIRNSIYKKFLDPDKMDLKDTLFETIRLAYVGLFHKVENFIYELEELPEILSGQNSNITTKHWAKEQFNFDLKKWSNFRVIQKVNWVCNCVKHKDGYPVKTPKPIEYIDSDETIKLKLTAQEFKDDCDALINFYPILIQTYLLIFQHKTAFSNSPNYNDSDFSEEFLTEQKKRRIFLDEGVHKMINLTKIL